VALLVSYDLRGPGQDYSGLIKELKRKPPWWHHLKSTWIVSTDETPDQLYERLKEHLDKNDRILIIEITESASRQGLLSKRAWDWIRNTVGD
jgi:hypothetical protein